MSNKGRKKIDVKEATFWRFYKSRSAGESMDKALTRLLDMDDWLRKNMKEAGIKV
jgi:hypothetical protein